MAPYRGGPRQVRTGRSPKSSPKHELPPNIRVNMRGLVVTMQSSFRSFGLGLFLAILLVYLILVAQFSSFIDPFLIILAVPTGLVGVMITLALTGTTLNIQSLMGVVMLQGMVVSNSILIVDFANVLRGEGRSLRNAVAHACRIRLRPILMTSLATVVGLLPMAFKLETGSEAYAPLARAIIGGLLSSDRADHFRRARGVPVDVPAPAGSSEAAATSPGDNPPPAPANANAMPCTAVRFNGRARRFAHPRRRRLPGKRRKRSALQTRKRSPCQNHPAIQSGLSLGFCRAKRRCVKCVRQLLSECQRQPDWSRSREQ